MEESIIDLADYLPEGEKVVSEWEEGKRIGDQIGISGRVKALGESQYITVKLPESIRYISPAFLEGFLSDTVRQYGFTGFTKRVRFTDAPLYDISDNLNEAIDRILTEQSAELTASAWT